MGMMQLALPVVVILAFLVVKVNHDQKRWLFKVPLVVSSTAFSIIIGHMASGVMGFYGAAFRDLLLYPGMLVIKKLWEKKEAKLTENGTVKMLPKAPKLKKGQLVTA